MTGSSSRWYAINARFSRSRSSATRARASEMLKHLLGGVDDRVRLFALEPFTVVDAPPGDGDRVHVGRFGGPDVKRRVADVRRFGRLCVHALGREQQRLG